jgi:hypothetical protein
LNNTLKGKSPLAFFLLAAAMGIPIFIFADVQVFPNILLFNFAAFLPVTAAMILVYRENGTAGMVELLRRSVDYKRIKSRIWYLPILLTWPFIVFVQYQLALLSGSPVSSPHFSFWTPIGFVIIFIAALGEELGWMGYAFEPMQERFGALKASLLLGVVWASAHIPLFTAGGAFPSWIIWQCIYIAATRVLFVWIYNNAGKSLFAIAIMHTLFNTIWQFFPPRAGSVGLLVPAFYNPSSLAITTAVLAAIVTFLWGSKTLAQYRYARIDEK